jgi:hypothetical protein
MGRVAQKLERDPATVRSEEDSQGDKGGRLTSGAGNRQAVR